MTMTAERAKQLHLALAETLRKFGQEHNVSIETGTFTYGSDSFRMSVTGVLKEQNQEESCFGREVSAKDIVRIRRDWRWNKVEGKTFKYKNSEYKIEGLRSSTNAVIRNAATGDLHLFKCSAIETIASNLFA